MIQCIVITVVALHESTYPVDKRCYTILHACQPKSTMADLTCLIVVEQNINLCLSITKARPYADPVPS